MAIAVVIELCGIKSLSFAVGLYLPLSTTLPIFVGGIVSFLSLGQLEDPEFTIKNALITTTYPGASPTEVEQEITDRLELAIQEMQEIDFIESFSKAGLSVIKVEVKPEYWADRLPQVWDTLRRKIRDVEADLPPGAGRPQVNDDFGDVFGFQLAVVGDGDASVLPAKLQNPHREFG